MSDLMNEKVEVKDKPGTTTAIVGNSCSGKTMIGKLLVRSEAVRQSDA